jgi:hypothetical protein
MNSGNATNGSAKNDGNSSSESRTAPSEREGSVFEDAPTLSEAWDLLGDRYLASLHNARAPKMLPVINANRDHLKP